MLQLPSRAARPVLVPGHKYYIPAVELLQINTPMCYISFLIWMTNVVLDLNVEMGEMQFEQV